MVKNRVEWLDVAKAFGIFAIYLGHFGDAAGAAYHFVFSFHIALFFFLSGCTENLNRHNSIRKDIAGIVKSLLFPAYFFSFYRS